MNRLRRLIEYRTHQHKGRLVQECKEHLVLVDLIEAGRMAEAADFLHDHFDRAQAAKAGLIGSATTRKRAPRPRAGAAGG